MMFSTKSWWLCSSSRLNLSVWRKFCCGKEQNEKDASYISDQVFSVVSSVTHTLTHSLFLCIYLLLLLYWFLLASLFFTRRVTASRKSQKAAGCAGSVPSASFQSASCVLRRVEPWNRPAVEPSGSTSAVPCGFQRWRYLVTVCYFSVTKKQTKKTTHNVTITVTDFDVKYFQQSTFPWKRWLITSNEKPKMFKIWIWTGSVCWSYIRLCLLLFIK